GYRVVGRMFLFGCISVEPGTHFLAERFSFRWILEVHLVLSAEPGCRCSIDLRLNCGRNEAARVCRTDRSHALFSRAESTRTASCTEMCRALPLSESAQSV